MAKKPRELGDFKEVGQFEAKFYVEELRFAPMSVVSSDNPWLLLKEAPTSWVYINGRL